MNFRIVVCVFLLFIVDYRILIAGTNIQDDKKTIVKCNVSDKTTPPQIACMFKLRESKNALSLYVSLLRDGYNEIRNINFLVGNRTLILIYWVFKNVKSDGGNSYLEIDLMPELKNFFEARKPFIVLKRKRGEHLVDLCIIPW